MGERPLGVAIPPGCPTAAAARLLWGALDLLAQPQPDSRQALALATLSSLRQHQNPRIRTKADTALKDSLVRQWNKEIQST